MRNGSLRAEQRLSQRIILKPKIWTLGKILSYQGIFWRACECDRHSPASRTILTTIFKTTFQPTFKTTLKTILKTILKMRVFQTTSCDRRQQRPSAFSGSYSPAPRAWKLCVDDQRNDYQHGTGEHGESHGGSKTQNRCKDARDNDCACGSEALPDVVGILDHDSD